MKAFILCALLLFVVAANAGRVAMPVARSDDQDYDVGELNSLCENGRRIDNVEECEKAANQLNQDFWGEEEVSGYPGGCYLWYGTVYFNKNSAGVKEAESQPICGLGYSGPWILGEPGETCQQVCDKKGQYCNDERQSTLTTNQLVAEKMAEAGYTCKGFHGARDYPGTPFSTGRNDDCAPMTPGSKSVCNGQTSPSHRSLCYCDGGDLTSTTTTTTINTTTTAKTDEVCFSDPQIGKYCNDRDSLTPQDNVSTEECHRICSIDPECMGFDYYPSYKGGYCQRFRNKICSPLRSSTGEFTDSIHQMKYICETAQPTALLNPNSPGCWIRFPSGCPNQKHEKKYDNLQDPTIWKNETFNGASESIDKCIARKSQINTWCGVSDVIIKYQSGQDAAGDAGRDALCWEGHSQYYSGKIAISEKGHICKSWADKKDSTIKVQGEKIKIQDGYFPDGSLENAANYCRSPDNDRYGPWCFVDGDQDAWQYCDVPLCNGAKAIAMIEKRLEKMEADMNFLNEENDLNWQQDWDDDEEEDLKQDSSMDEDASKASNSGDVGTKGPGSICTFGKYLCM